MKVKESLGWKSKWTIEKFKDDKAYTKGKPYAVESFEGNIGLQEGRQELIDLICGIGSPTKWDNTNARLGVGDSSTAENETQDGLQAATNKFWKGMLATYPQKTDQTAEWKAEFVSGEANFAWEEFTVVNASDDAGKNLNRKVVSKGTKSSGETWTLSLKITFNAS